MRRCWIVWIRRPTHRSSRQRSGLAALAGDSAVELDQLVELAEQAVAANPGSPAELCTLGLAHYRAGQFGHAIERLRESIDMPTSGDESVIGWLGLALTYHRQGKKDEARSWFEKAVQWTERHKLARPSDPSPTGALPMYSGDSNFDCIVLLREAEQLIGLKPDVEEDSDENTE